MPMWSMEYHFMNCWHKQHSCGVSNILLAVPIVHYSPLPSALVWADGSGLILGLAQAYLRDLCYPTLGTRGCSSLRSMERGVLFVPFARTSTRQAHAFSVVGPCVWNGLPLALQLLPRVHSDAFYPSLKTALLAVLESGALLNSE